MFSKANSMEELQAAYAKKRAKLMRGKSLRKCGSFAVLSFRLEHVKGQYHLRAEEIARSQR